jgi:hypothetical protein
LQPIVGLKISLAYGASPIQRGLEIVIEIKRLPGFSAIAGLLTTTGELNGLKKRTTQRSRSFAIRPQNQLLVPRRTTLRGTSPAEPTRVRECQLCGSLRS